MTLNDLTVNFSHLDRSELLSDWHWLIGEEYLPILISAAGDAFVQHIQSGEVWWLNTGEAIFTVVANSPEEFNQSLTDKDFVVDAFAVEMIGDLLQSEKSLNSGQVYGLTTPWLLGGEYEFSNIETVDIEVHFSITGQIAKQVSAKES